MPPENSTPYEDADSTQKGTGESAASSSAPSDTPLGLRRSDRSRSTGSTSAISSGSFSGSSSG
ncbi:MAG: hypothetical protein WBA01_18460, partial [Phormidesmis sp.]